MKKELNYLAVIPFYGASIVLFYLFILVIKEKISKKKFTIVFSLCWTIIHLILSIIYKNLNILFFKDIKDIVQLFIAGYMANAFTFPFINEKWDYLFANDENDFF